MVNENICKYIIKCLEDKGYIIDCYRGVFGFHANHKDNYLKSIDVYAVDDEVKMVRDISIKSYGETLKKSIDEFTKLYNDIENDILDIQINLLDFSKPENCKKMLDICGVPNEVKEYFYAKSL